MKNSTLIDRVRKVVDYEEISVRLFEKKINATQGVINKAIKNNTDIKGSLLISIVENYTHISPVWLLTGKGRMLLNTEEENISGLGKCKECESLREKVDLLEKLVDSKEQTIKAYESKSTETNGNSKRTSA